MKKLYSKLATFALLGAIMNEQHGNPDYTGYGKRQPNLPDLPKITKLPSRPTTIPKGLILFEIDFPIEYKREKYIFKHAVLARNEKSLMKKIKPILHQVQEYVAYNGIQNSDSRFIKIT